MNNPNDKKYKYTVGILIFHRYPHLVEMAKDCVRSVINSCDRDETQIIIVDNGSTEKTDFWQENSDIYIRFHDNMGIARGWNAILKSARGEYINILGDDTKVRPNWLPALQEAMDMPDCGVANLHVEHLPVGKGIIENYKWFSGACFMLTPKTIEKVGYFDESIFPATSEDWSYWLATYKAGLKLYVNYAMTVQHLEGQTDNSPDIAVHNQRLLRKLAKDWNITNPTAIFCGHLDIKEELKKGGHHLQGDAEYANQDGAVDTARED